MSNDLGATKINDLINTADTSDNEDDEVVSNILNELEGTGDDNMIDEPLLEDLSNNQEDMDDDDDNLFNTNNNIFNSSEISDTPSDKAASEPQLNNNIITDNDVSENSDSGMDLSSYLSPDLQEIFDLVKYPVIVIIVVMLVNNEFVVTHLSQIKLFITDEKINMYGYALQAVLAGLILLSIMYIMKVCSK